MLHLQTVGDGHAEGLCHSANNVDYLLIRVLKVFVVIWNVAVACRASVRDPKSLPPELGD